MTPTSAAERVVVAEADLVDRGRVVLVDDRHDRHVEEAVERAARVQVGLPMPGVVPREQHLSDRDVALAP